jgi:hypothetical protein
LRQVRVPGAFVEGRHRRAIAAFEGVDLTAPALMT